MILWTAQHHFLFIQIEYSCHNYTKGKLDFFGTSRYWLRIKVQFPPSPLLSALSPQFFIFIFYIYSSSLLQLSLVRSRRVIFLYTSSLALDRLIGGQSVAGWWHQCRFCAIVLWVQGAAPPKRQAYGTLHAQEVSGCHSIWKKTSAGLQSGESVVHSTKEEVWIITRVVVVFFFFNLCNNWVTYLFLFLDPGTWLYHQNDNFTFLQNYKKKCTGIVISFTGDTLPNLLYCLPTQV